MFLSGIAVQARHTFASEVCHCSIYNSGS